MNKLTNTLLSMMTSTGGETDQLWGFIFFFFTRIIVVQESFCYSRGY